MVHSSVHHNNNNNIVIVILVVVNVIFWSSNILYCHFVYGIHLVYRYAAHIIMAFITYYKYYIMLCYVALKCCKFCRKIHFSLHHLSVFRISIHTHTRPQSSLSLSLSNKNIVQPTQLAFIWIVPMCVCVSMFE